MAKKTAPPLATSPTEPSDKLLPKISLFFFKRRWMSLAIWAVLVVFGIVSYTTLLKREGFPSIAIPIVIVNGSYDADAATIDKDIAKPLIDIALKQPGVASVTSSSQSNFLTTTITYDESVDPKQAKSDLQKAVQASAITKDAKLNYAAPYFGATGGSLEKIDATVSLYSEGDTYDTQQLAALADKAVPYLNKNKGSQVETYFVQSPYSAVGTSQSSVQRNFDRYAEVRNGKPSFHNAVIIGVSGADNFDVITLDDQVKESLAALEGQADFKNVDAAVSASFAPSIKENISELQRVLIEGLLAVLVIGSIVIALRASLITVLAMLSVVSMTIGLLFVTGYSLNVITLFAIILGLSLIVDDTIIMVEALDAARRRHTNARDVVRAASRRVSRAMVAATLTAAFSFTPLLFVSGVLGSFIRAIPFTIISSLLISLAVAIIFIPLFARYILLRPKQLGVAGKVLEPAAGLERRIATFISRPMVWSKGSRRRQFTTGTSAVVLSLIFIVAAGFLFSKVTFNIFPSSKDSNQIAISITYPPGSTIVSAQATADQVDAVVSQTLGQNLEDASYYGVADSQSAVLNVNLIPYGERDVTAPQLIDQLNDKLKDKVAARVNAYQVDVGPPVSGFTVNIQATDRQAAITTANDMAAFLRNKQLTRTSGKVAHFTDVSVGNTDVYERSDKTPVLSVSADFDGTDTSTLTALAQTAVTEEYGANRLQKLGLPADALSFNIGQESENQDSFKSLALAFPIVLLAIFILLAIQFRSLLQPLLIFMAVPFSLFGVAFGLYITDNAISFFALLGFFALIGLSIKNTILLTDYANQERRAGMGPIDAAVAALSERFRPLVATSLTAIVSLLPLALTSPFWEGLAFTLVFGLASSTLLVILVFPYYYLAGEYLRLVGRRLFKRLRPARHTR